MKVSIEVHAGGDLLRDVVAEYLTQANPSVLLKRIVEGIQLATVHPDDAGPCAALAENVDDLRRKWEAIEKTLYETMPYEATA